MARIDPDRRELTATLAVFGASRAGKSSVLRAIHDKVEPARRTGDVPIGLTPGADALFDWLMLDLGAVAGWHVRVHLYAVPPHGHADATRRLVLTEADGVLVVLDAQAVRLAENLEALQALEEQLLARPDEGRGVPRVFLQNKSDLPAELRLPADVLDDALNFHEAASVPCAAVHGTGVLDALQIAITLVMRRLVAAEGAAG